MPYTDAAEQREYQRQWRLRRRARYTDGVVCGQCGSADQINWHHRDPATKLDHRIWSWAIPRLEAELAKCTPLCNVCHSRHHLARPIAHGTHSGYSHHGCRCAECKAAHAAYNRLR